MFELTDRTGGHHHSLVFRAGLQFTSTSSSEYAAQKSSFIDVINNNFYSSNRFNKIRLKFGSPASGTNPSVFGGAVLQVQIDDTVNAQPPSNIYLKIYQNTKLGGWISNSSVITKYGQNDQIPIWDTTESANAGQFYTDHKTVYIQNNNRVETTVEKNYRFEDGVGYPDSQKNSDTNWQVSGTSPGYPLVIQINRWLNMGGSTIMNLWDSPNTWVLDTNGSVNSNLDGIDLDTQKRGKTAVNLKTVNRYYQKQGAPIRPYVGTRDKMIDIMGTTKLGQTYSYTSGYHAYLQHQAAGTGSVNNPTNEALIFRHDEVGELCNVGNGYQQIKKILF